MASRQQRYIPHVRDVFQSPSNGGGGANQQNGAGRRGSPLALLFDDRGHKHGPQYVEDQSSYTSFAAVEHASRMQHRGDQQYGNYGRTLTEKDVKHIERHLSMKKTIRKQLSRHLTQSYLDAESNDVSSVSDVVAANRRHRNDKNSAASSANKASSETNFLELLKDVRSDDGDDLDRDSGHCSPTDDLDVVQLRWQKSFGSKHCNNSSPKNAVVEVQETKKSSFWKKLTVRAKIKH